MTQPQPPGRIARVAINDESDEFDPVYGEDLFPSSFTRYTVRFIEWDPDPDDPAEEVAKMPSNDTQEDW